MATLNLKKISKGYYRLEAYGITITISNPKVSGGMGSNEWQLIVADKHGDVLVDEWSRTKKEAVKLATNWVVENEGNYNNGGSIESDNFKIWFGDSKVVDENGNPLVVYHGSNNDISRFHSFSETMRKRNEDGMWDSFVQFGNFFSSSPETADFYAETDRPTQHKIDSKERVEATHKSMMETKDVKKRIAVFNKHKKIEDKYKEGVENKEIFEYYSDTIYPVYLSLQNPLIVEGEGKSWFKVLPDIYNNFDYEKYDGIIFKNIIEAKGIIQTTYVTFLPNQIKSAIGNNGDYDQNNPDITMEKGGLTMADYDEIVDVKDKMFKGGEVESYNKWKATDWSKIPNSKERERAFRVLNWIEDDRINYSKLDQETRDKIEDYLENDYLTEALTNILEEDIKGLENQYYVLEEEEEIVDEKSFLKVLNSNDYKGLREGLKKYNLTHRSFDDKNVDELVKDYIDGLNKKQLIDYFIFDEEKWDELLYNSELRDQIDFSDLYNSIVDLGAVFTEEEEEQQYDMFAEVPNNSIEKNNEEWFKGSKVVDKDGNPLVVYHGTNAAFDEFSLDKNRFGNKSGIHFSKDINGAKPYGRNIKKAYLSIKNPMDFETNFEIRKKILKDKFGKTFETMTTKDWLEKTTEIDSLFREDAEKRGYDGVFDVSQPEIVVFSPEQIKLLPTETKEDLTKQVNALIEKKKKLYPNPDIESVMSADEKQLDKDIAGLWSKINQLVAKKQNSKKEEGEQKILDSGITFKKIEASELKKGDLVATAYDKFSVVDDVKVMPKTTKVFYSTFYDGYNKDESLFWTFKNYEELRIVDLEKGQLITQVSSKGGADVTYVTYEVNIHGAYASIKGDGRNGTTNFNKKDIDKALGSNWRDYQPKVDIDILGVLGKVKTAYDFDSELFEKRLSKRYSDVNKLVEDYKVFDTEKGDKFYKYEGLMKDAIDLMNAGSGTPRVVYKELGLNDFINKRAALKTIKQFDKFLDEAIILLENAIVTSLNRTDDAGISLMGDKYDEFIKKYPKTISRKKEPIAVAAKKDRELPNPHLTKTANKKLQKFRKGIIVNLNGMTRGGNTLYKYAETVEEAYQMALDADLESYQIWYIYPSSDNKTTVEYAEAWLFPDDFKGDIRDDNGNLKESAKLQAIKETKKALGIEVEKEESLTEQLTKEIEALNEYLEEAKEEDSKELISELEDRIEFLEELLEDESDDNNELLAPNGKKSNLTAQQYELVRTTEFKDWFGDWETDPNNSSKVLDENGEPLVVYHGAKIDGVGFTKFITKKMEFERNVGNYAWKEFGAFFTDSYETAEYYAGLGKHWEGDNWDKNRGEIRVFFLNVRNPLIEKYNNEKWYSIIPAIFETERWSTWGRKDKDFVGKEYTPRNPKYDGFIVSGIDEVEVPNTTTYHIKKSNQAKLADGSNTKFSSKNLDIRFDYGGGVGNSDIGESRLMDLTESSVIALNNHLIGLSLQISELIKARLEFLQNMSDEDYYKLKAGVYDFKENVSDTQSYEEWLKESKEIDKENGYASDAIQSFPRNEMGLTTDEVKGTDEYKLANKQYKNSWKKLQEFNRNSPKEFKRRASTERRQAMMSKNKG